MRGYGDHRLTFGSRLSGSRATIMSTLRLHTEPMVLRVARAIASYIGFGDENDIRIQEPATIRSVPRTATPKPRLERSLPVQSTLRLMPDQADTKPQPSLKWRRHAQLRAYEPALPEDVRQGRHAAVRGLFAAREGALDVATRHFALAAQCDEVDLTAIPGFWNLTRGQMQTAVDAYESVGRHRDAAALDAHIETIFRPSLVGASQQPIVPARPRHKAAST